MPDWIAQRAKAFMAAIAVAIVMAVITTFQQQFGLPVPEGIATMMLDFVKHMFDMNTAVTALATGFTVHQVPNRT